MCLQNAKTYQRNLMVLCGTKMGRTELQRVITALMRITVRLMMKILGIVRNTKEKQQYLKMLLGI